MNYRILLTLSLLFSIPAVSAMDGKPVAIALIPETDPIYAVSLLDAFMNGEGAIASQSDKQISFPHAREQTLSLSQASARAYTLLEKLTKEKLMRGSGGDMPGMILRAKRLFNLSNEAAVDQYMGRMSYDHELLIRLVAAKGLFKDLFTVASQDELTAIHEEGILKSEEAIKDRLKDDQSPEAVEKVKTMRTLVKVLPEYLNSRYALLQALKGGISSEINAASSKCIKTEFITNGRSEFRTNLLENVVESESKGERDPDCIVM